MEKKLVFSDYGCEIFKQDEKFFIVYDSGESAGSKLIEKEINYQEYQQAIKSEHDAYLVILKRERLDSA
jgi:hypothetical protein